MRHYTVLRRELVDGVYTSPTGVYVDTTTGLAGHSEELVQRLQPPGRLFCLDRDSESLELAKQRLAPFAELITFLHAPFSQLEEKLAEHKITQVDGLMADLGTSRLQLTTHDRGFSFSNDGPIDMRMDRTSDGPTAADIVNRMPERELADLLFYNAEERSARSIARAIVAARPHTSTQQLAEVIAKAVRPTKPGRLHPASLSFMAIRIATNDELGELDSLLSAIPRLMKPGGRVGLISFHSLEDRPCKVATKQWHKERKATLINKHVIVPCQQELAENPPSRSAKLRLVEFL